MGRRCAPVKIFFVEPTNLLQTASLVVWFLLRAPRVRELRLLGSDYERLLHEAADDRKRARGRLLLPLFTLPRTVSRRLPSVISRGSAPRHRSPGDAPTAETDDASPALKAESASS